MERKDRTAAVTTLLTMAAGVGIAFVGSRNGASVADISVFAIGVAVAFALNWIAFVPAYLAQTERFFDLLGSLSFITVTAVAAILAPELNGRSILLTALVVIWAMRLGAFLVRRVHKAGRDDRFDELKPSFVRFLNVWTLQGLWVSVTVAPTLAAITTGVTRQLGVCALVGALLWLAGFAIEVLADAQKSRFRADPDNRGRFIQRGLWSWSRHPNYFGEIVVWVGIALIAAPTLRGAQWITLISPLFVAVLLTRISGIPMLERKANARWGGEPDYEEYKRRTPQLIPVPPKLTRRT